MPWLKERLRTLNKTPAGLARELGVAPPRVYEMIAGRRAMQPDEIEPTARFLEWPVQDVIAHLPEEARVIPATLNHKNMIPVLGTTRTLDLSAWDCLLTGETTNYIEQLPAFRGRTDIECLHISTPKMWPWRDPGDLVIFEKQRPANAGDYVVIYLVEDKKSPVYGDEQLRQLRKLTRVMVRQLLQSKSTNKLRLRQYNPQRDTEIDRKIVASMFRVLSWNDVLR